MNKQSKVKYIGADDDQIKWGNNDDPRKILIVGEIYIVSHTEIHSWHTKLYLKGIQGKFNSVCFEEIK